jgi:phosphoserine phosphatase RsbU/P
MPVRELIGGAIGCTLFVLGAASCVVWMLRRRPTDRLMLLFGLWSCAYGMRLIADQTFVREAIGGSSAGWDYVTAGITYAINVIGGLFFENLVGAGWKHSIRIVWVAQAIYAVIAITVDVILHRPGAAMGPGHVINSFIVVIGLIVALANLRLYRARLSPLFKSRVIAIGGIVLTLFVLNENLHRPLVPSVDLEPIGVSVFIVCLGYAVAATVFQSEADLIAVQRELETARQIQTSLLPRELPRLQHLDLAVRYLPMTAVAGDLYDVVALSPARVGILVADVSGHGIPAALVASMVKLAFASQSEHADDPARVLRAMNRVLCSHVETFVTAVYVVIDSENRTITYANAGHPPVLIGRADSHIDVSREHGCVLGVLPEADYTNEQLTLAPGDRVWLYTDGIPETRNAKDVFLDQERMEHWLTSDGHGTAGEFADTVLRQLREWRGRSAFDDDVTFVIARFL